MVEISQEKDNPLPNSAGELGRIVVDKAAAEPSEASAQHIDGPNQPTLATPVSKAASSLEPVGTAPTADSTQEEPYAPPHIALPPSEKNSAPLQKKRVSFRDQEPDEAHDDARPAASPPAPPKSPHPPSARAQAEATLIEAFPGIDAKVVKAVLLASGGNVEPAFDALLSMSDPDAQEPVPPVSLAPTRTKTSQVEADELYARQLTEQYNASFDSYQSSQSFHDPYPARAPTDPFQQQPRRREVGTDQSHDREHSFIDDDLPAIRDNLSKGFQETKNTINRWIKDFQKKIDGDDKEDEPILPRGPSQPIRHNFGPSQSEQLHAIRRTAEATRRSGERDAYDADPQLLGDNFEQRLELKDDEVPPAKPPRPLANPNLFKSGEASQETGLASFGSRTSSLNPASKQSSPTPGPIKTGKWQPLTSLEPKAEVVDHDPFSLDDSDEDTNHKKDTTSKSNRSEAASKPAGIAPAPTRPVADLSTSEPKKEPNLTVS